jgi:carbon storage regulator
MLILSRKTDELIRINANIVVKIISISDNQVKIGIDAPSEVVVLRGEIYEKVKQSTIEAAKQSSQTKNLKLPKLAVNKLKAPNE